MYHDTSLLQLGHLLLTKNNELFIVSHSIISDSIKRHTIKNINLANNSITSRTIKDREVKSQDLNQYLAIEHLSIKNELTVEDAINAESIDLGTNTITDQNFSGNWNFNGGNLTTTGTLTIGAINSNGTINGNTITTGTGTLTLNTYTLVLTNNTQLNQSLLTTSSPTFNTLFLTNPTNTTTSVVTIDGTQTLTNKTLSASTNTITALTNANLSGTAGITNANLEYSTISGIALGTNLATLTFGTHLTGTSYNGATNVTIATDATDANTVSTIVARDASGNFQANTITASIIGASSLNVLKSGDTMTGNLNLGANTLTTTNSTLISNLNADLLDNQHGSYYAPLSNITGTQNYLAKFTATNSVGSSNVYADGVNVGIGTAAPTQIFQINSSATTAFVVTSAGNVGIGTTSPGAALDVNGNIRSNGYYSRLGDTTRWGFHSTTQNILYAYVGNNRAMSLGTSETTFNLENLDSDFVVNWDSGEAFRMEGSSGNVGIGTTAPGAALQVYDADGGILVNGYSTEGGANNASVLNGQITLGNNASYQGRISYNGHNGGDEFMSFVNTYNATTRGFKFITGASSNPIVTMLGSGNVGIGTTSPGAPLHITYAPGTSSVPGLIVEGTSNVPLIKLYRNQTVTAGSIGQISFFDNPNGGTVNTEGAKILATTDTSATTFALSFFTHNGSSLGEKMRIDSSGNVGIGTTGPTVALDVVGAGKFSTGLTVTTGDTILGNNSFKIDGSGNMTWGAGRAIGILTWGTGHASIGSQSGNELRLLSNGSQRAVIDISGNVGIGTTSPSNLLSLNGTNAYSYSPGTGGSANPLDAGSKGLYIKHDSAGSNFIVFDEGGSQAYIGGFTGNTSYRGASVVFGRRTGATNYDETMRIDGISGNVGIGNVAPGSRLVIKGANQLSTSSALNITDSADGSLVFVQNNGNVGIGTTSPTDLLYLSKSNFTGSGITMEGTNPGIIFKQAGTLYGQIEVLTASGDMAQYVGSGAGQLGWYTKANGNVGIGATGPGEKLEVVGNIKIGSGGVVYSSAGNLLFGAGSSTERWRIESAGSVLVGGAGTSQGVYIRGEAGSSSGVNYGFNGDINTGIYSPSDGNIQFAINGADKVRINSDGNVGIGTTGPGSKLTLSSAVSTTLHIMTTADTYSPTIRLEGYNRNWYTGNLDVGVDGNFVFSRNTDLSSADVTIQGSSGNVGIGTTNPGLKLDVVGDIRTSAAVYGVGSWIGQHGPTTNGGAIRFVDWSASEKMRIDTISGNVGIGTTSPEAKLGFVAATTAAGGINFGSDTNLYRSAANMLKTDDDFSSASLIVTRTGGTAIDLTGASGAYAMDANNNSWMRWKDTGGTSRLILGVGISNQTGLFSVPGGDINIWSEGTSGQGITVKTTTGNVGIGTTGPLEKLHVVGNIRASSGLLFADGVYGIRHIGSGVISFDAGTSHPTEYKFTTTGVSTGAMVIKSDGNVGIGTTNPGAKLQILSAYSVSDQTLLKAGNDWYTNFNLILRDQGSSWSNRKLVFNYDPDNSHSVDYMTFMNGNVGIGTTSPSYKLNVAGDGYNLRLANSTNAEGYNIGRNVTDGYLYFYGDEPSYDGYIFSGVGGEKMRIQPSGNVGIGTTNPGAKLDVVGGIRLGSNGSATTNYDISRHGDGYLQFVGNQTGYVGYKFTADASGGGVTTPSFEVADAGGSRFVIKNGGNVGIGTTSPGALLQVGNTTYGANVLGYFATDGGHSARIGVNSNGTSIVVGAVGSTGTPINGIPTSAVGIISENTQPLILGVNNTEWMRIQSNGNVGIGTTGPNLGKLQVNGNLIVGSGFANSSIFSSSLYGHQGTDLNYALQVGTLFTDGIKLNTFNDAGNTNIPLELNASKIAFKIGEAEKVRINSDGNVGIGTTAPGAKLDVTGNVYLTGSTGNNYIDFKPSGTQKAIVGMAGPIKGTASQDLALFAETGQAISFMSGGSGTDAMTIASTGNVGIGTTAPGYLLDVKSDTDTVGAIGRTAVGYVSGLSDYAFMSHVDMQSTANYALVQSALGVTYINAAATKSINFGIGGTVKNVMDSSGNVGIGTTSPTQKLTVAGNINVVGGSFIDDGTTLSVPDYVFEPGYTLRTIPELETYLEQNLHLPGVLSREQVKKNGMNYGAMMMSLLEKTEENTLYTIANYKNIKENQTQIAQISDQFATLSDAIHLTITRENVDLPTNREVEAPRNREVTISADTINLAGNVIANGLNLNTAITGITENQNKIVNQLTGQLADQSLSVDNKLQLIGQALNDVQTHSNASLQEQIDAQTKDIFDLQKQMVDVQLQNKAFNDFLLAFDVKNIDNFAKLNAPLNAFTGKITASDIDALNKIKATDIEATNSLKGQNLELGAQTSGKATIKMGETEVEISTPNASETARISITPHGDTFGNILFYDDVVDGESFKVKIKKATTEGDIKFDWLIVK
jgi:hypothetical protein